MTTLGQFLALGVGAAGLLATAAYTGDQTILGRSITVKSTPGDSTKRKVKGSAKESSSTNTLVGDPTLAGSAGGAVLTIAASGTTPSAQTFVLSQGTSSVGTPFWSGDAQKGFKYKDAHGDQGAVKSVGIKLAPSGSFSIKVSLTGKNGPVAIVPPNPGSDACLALQIGVGGTSGDRYSVQFGPESRITNKGDVLFKASRPTNEGICPIVTTTTPSTTSTTTITMIDRCCVAGACLRLNPPACSDFGGTPIGDGSCQPNPCPPTTTTTTTMIGSPSGAFQDDPLAD
jgi:hypothetical protein